MTNSFWFTQVLKLKVPHPGNPLSQTGTVGHPSSCKGVVPVVNAMGTYTWNIPRTAAMPGDIEPVTERIRTSLKAQFIKSVLLLRLWSYLSGTFFIFLFYFIFFGHTSQHAGS